MRANAIIILWRNTLNLVVKLLLSFNPATNNRKIAYCIIIPRLDEIVGYIVFASSLNLSVHKFPEHISYTTRSFMWIIKLCVCVHLGKMVCRIPKLGHWPIFWPLTAIKENGLRSISPTLISCRIIKLGLWVQLRHFGLLQTKSIEWGSGGELLEKIALALARVSPCYGRKAGYYWRSSFPQ